jgi:hypothetical protein
MIKHIFLTFSYKDINDLTLERITTTLLTLDKYAKVIGVKELHHDGINFHFHVLIILKTGISKNTYHKVIRDLFPVIKGFGLDVAGVRNIKFTVKYILKDVISPSQLYLSNITLNDFLKLSNNMELYAYFSILEFKGTFDE